MGTPEEARFLPLEEENLGKRSRKKSFLRLGGIFTTALVFVWLAWLTLDTKGKMYYRTHLHMGSDHWVAMSVTPYKRILKPCEDLVKTVNVVNVVKI